MGRRNRYRSQNRIFRSRSNRWVAGVCGGLSRHMGISSFWLRVLALICMVSLFPVSLLFYFIAAIVMPKEPDAFVPPIPQPAPHEMEQPRYQEPEPVRYREAAAPPPPPNPRPSRLEESFARAKAQDNGAKSLKVLEAEFDDIEQKIRMMEDYVTSKEFQVQKKFENL